MRRVMLLVIGVVGVASGCAPVRPWEREHMARRSMELREPPLAAQHRARTVESTTGGGLPGEAPGGGCGCTQ